MDRMPQSERRACVRQVGRGMEKPDRGQRNHLWSPPLAVGARQTL